MFLATTAVVKFSRICFCSLLHRLRLAKVGSHPTIDHSPEHFSFAPKDQFAALRYARSKGLKILANWHSHPATPSRPSQEDLRLANDPTIRYAILSLLNDEPRLNSFKILNGEIIDKEAHL